MMRLCMSAIKIIHELISYYSQGKVIRPQAWIFFWWTVWIIISLHEDVILWPSMSIESLANPIEISIILYWTFVFMFGGNRTSDAVRIGQMVWKSLKACNNLAICLCGVRLCDHLYFVIKDMGRQSLNGLHARQMIFHNRSSSFNQRLAKTWIILRYLGIMIPVLHTVILFFFCQNFLLPNEPLISLSIQLLVMTSLGEKWQRNAGKPISNVFWFEFFTYLYWLAAFTIYWDLSSECQSSIAANTIEAFRMFSEVIVILQSIVHMSIMMLMCSRIYYYVNDFE